MAVTDSQVAAYSGLVESLAWKLAGLSGAEYDDLYQEGHIAVILSLKAGRTISKDFVRYRMLKWCRYLRRLQNNDGIAYEVMLPLEYDALDSV